MSPTTPPAGSSTERRMSVFFDPAWIVADFELETVTKAAVVAERIGRRRPDVDLVRPEPASIDDLLRVHDRDYVDALLTGEPRQLATGGLGRWSPEILASVLGSTGGVTAAMRTARERGTAGSLSSGLHHARRDGGAGFCTVNGLALAAVLALAEGVDSVGILDTDAHFGGGTHSIVGDDERVRIADVSTNAYDQWRSDKERHRTEFVTDVDRYLDAVNESLDHVGDVGLLLYNAGMDPADTDRIQFGCGIPDDVLAERERVVAAWCERTSTPVAFVLAGGYGAGDDGLSIVADLHMHTIDAFAAITR